MRRLAAALLVSLTTALGCTTGADRAHPTRSADVATSRPAPPNPWFAGLATPADTTGSPLDILSTTPSGEVASLRESEAIAVTFSRPMVELRAVDDSLAGGPFTIEPALAGRFRWRGTETAVFEPAGRLPFATRFTVTIPAGVRSRIEPTAVVKQPVTFTFETPRPRLLAPTPNDGATNLERRPTILLRFNQPMDPQTADLRATADGQPVEITKRYPTAKEMEGNRYYPDYYRYEQPGATKPDSTWLLAIQPTAELPKGAKLLVSLPAGLRGKEGTLGMAADAALRFQIYKPFAWTGESVQTPRAVLVSDTRSTATVAFRFASPVSNRSVYRALTISPAVKLPKWNDDDEPWRLGNVTDESFTLNLPLEPRTTYTITLPDTLTDRFGQKLGRAVTITVTPKDFEPTFLTPQGALTLAADGPTPTLRATAVNLNRFRVRYATLTNEAYLRQLRGGDERNQPIVPSNLTERTIALDGPVNTIQRFDLPLRAALGGASGFAYLDVTPLDGPKEMRREPRTLVVQRTDLGITIRSGPEGRVALVTRLSTADPVAGATVALYDPKGAVKQRGTTDRDGLVSLQPTGDDGQLTLIAEAKLGTERHRAALAVSSGGYYYRRWAGNGTQDVRAELFTDKGLYKAKETVHLKGIVRRKRPDLDPVRWASAPMTATLIVNDPNGAELSKQTVQVAATGGFAADVPLGADPVRGSYSAMLRLGSERNPTGQAYTSFQILDFRDATFEVTVKPEKTEIIRGDGIAATVSGRYLFGAPMPGQPVHHVVSAEFGWFVPAGDWSGYTFQPIDDQPALDFRREGDGSLGADGRFTVETKPELPNDGRPHTVTVEASVTDPARQVIAGRATVLVHPGTFYLGVKLPERFGKTGEPLTAQLVAVTPDGKPVAGRQVRWTLTRTTIRPVPLPRPENLDGRTFMIDGREMMQADTTVATGTATTATAPVGVRATPDEPGAYRWAFETSDARGNRLATGVYAWVTGSGGSPWWSGGDGLELKLDRDRYRPGETARLLIPNPFPDGARALVTLERRDIHLRRTLSLTGSTPVVEVPISAAMMPNVTVNVVLFRGLTSAPEADEASDILRTGQIDLPVDAAARHLRVAVTADKVKYEPGETVTLTISTTDSTSGAGVPADVTLAVADRAVLSLIDYTLPDPFATFYSPEGNEVSGHDLRDGMTLPKAFYQLEASPGLNRAYATNSQISRRELMVSDMMVAAAPQTVEANATNSRMMAKDDSVRGGGGEAVRVREFFRSLALWNPTVRTDASGKATVTFKLPDNLTTFRAMAVAASPDQFGRATLDLVVQKPLLAIASLPRFVRSHDRFTAGIVLTNRTGAAGTATVTAAATGIERTGPETQQVALADGESKEVAFGWTAGAVGTAKVTITARLGAKSDGVVTSFPVVEPRLSETVATFASSTADATETIRVPGGIYPDLGGVAVTLASTGLVGLDANVDYLFNYPYGCLEQRMSAVRPMLVGGDLVRQFGLVPTEWSNYRQTVQATLDELKSFQRDDGGLSYWKDADRSSPFVSAYALLTLAEAQAADYRVDPGVRDRLIGYVEQLAGQTKPPEEYGYYGEIVWRSVRAHMVHALSAHGRSTAKIRAALAGNLDQLAPFELAELLHGAARDRDAAQTADLRRRLMNTIKTEPTQAHFEAPTAEAYRWIFESDVRTTAAVLDALIASTTGEQPQADKVVSWLMAERKRAGRWSNTQDNVWVFRALTRYFERYEHDEPAFTATVRAEQQEILRASFSGRTLKTASDTLRFDRTKPGAAVALAFGKTGPGRLYRTVRMRYFPTRPADTRSEGFTIERTTALVDSARGIARKVGEYRAGDLVRVTLRVTTQQARHFVAVDDGLPAGFEAVETGFVTASQDEIQRGLNESGDGGGRFYRPWWNYGGFNHVEQRDDRVVLFADYLPAGTHTHSYLARITTPGTFDRPAATVEEMYTPEIFGRTASETITVW